jgi:hypothetical protein
MRILNGTFCAGTYTYATEEREIMAASAGPNLLSDPLETVLDLAEWSHSALDHGRDTGEAVAADTEAEAALEPDTKAEEPGQWPRDDEDDDEDEEDASGDDPSFIASNSSDSGHDSNSSDSGNDSSASYRPREDKASEDDEEEAPAKRKATQPKVVSATTKKPKVDLAEAKKPKADPAEAKKPKADPVTAKKV